MVDAKSKEEDELIQRLRTLCDVKGRETQPKKSADIIRQLGLIYRKRTPNKISLIKSIGLLNAAIVRKPANVSQIESDLFEVCQHILQLAGVKYQLRFDASLISKAKQYHTYIQRLRAKVDDLLQYSCATPISNNVGREELQNLQENKISSIQPINQMISGQYIAIIANVIEFCESLMGRPPCEYAVIGMGSVARNEATPYSDFEHIIVMEEQKNYEKNLEYFRWLSVISHAIVLNFQETIIPSLNIYGLNDSRSTFGDWFYDEQTRGVSFDGLMIHACKFPLGRQQPTENKPWITELIKPVGEMLKYLSSDDERKNDYHLSNILTKVCFVYGSQVIYRQFESGVMQHLQNQTEHELLEEIKEQTKSDLNNFSARFRLASLNSFDAVNIKQLIYRSSTLFIAALGRMHRISANSSFDVIDELAKNKKITQNMKHKLSYAVAIACEMRLKVYMDKKSQYDNAIKLKENEESARKFLNIVGEASTINYFQIAYCLQCEVAKQLQLTKLHFYSDPLLINVTICMTFGLKYFPTYLTKHASTKKYSKLESFDFDATIERLEKETEVVKKVLKKTSFRKRIIRMISGYNINAVEVNIEQTKSVADRLYSTKIYDEALEFYQNLLTVCESKAAGKANVAYALIRISRCLYQLDRPAESLNYAKRSLELYETISIDQKLDDNIAECMRVVGICLMDLREYRESLKFFNSSLQIYRSISKDEERDVDIAGTLNSIGLCLTKNAQNTLSLRYFKMSVKILQNLSADETCDKNVAIVLHNIGFCLKQSRHYDEALLCYQKSLKIKRNISKRGDEVDIASTLNNIGHCLFKLQRYDQSLAHHRESLTIYQNISLNEEKDIDIARTLNSVGKCLMKLQLYGESMMNLKKSLSIHQTILFFDQESPCKFSIAYPLQNVGLCLFDCRKFDEALDYLKQSLKVFNATPLNDEIKAKIFQTSSKIDECLTQLIDMWSTGNLA